MTVEERELERQLRATLASWVEEAPRSTGQWAAPPPPALRSESRRWLVWLVPVAVAASIVAAVLIVQVRSEKESMVVSGERDIVTAEVRVGDRRGVRVLAVGHGALFVASENDRRLYRVDMHSREVLSGPLLAVPDGVAVAGDSVVAILDGPTRLALLDPATLGVVQTTALTDEPVGFNVVADAIWARDANGQVRSFDLATLAPKGTLETTFAQGFQGQGGAGLWRTDPESGDVLRLDSATGAVLTRVPVGGEPWSVAVGDGAVWVADVANDRVVRIDPSSGRVVLSVKVGRHPHGLALGVGRLWVTNFEDGTVSTIDTDRDVVLSTVPIGVRPAGIVLDAGVLWVSVHQEALVRRLDPSELELRSLRPIGEQKLNVDIGGRTIFMRCMGGGAPNAPTVLLEAGGGEWSEHELFVQYGLQSTHRVCAYDRAGLGRSDPGPGPRTADRISDDLHRALVAAEISGPYVLVGHGYGGLYARYFASEHSSDVVGLVLVDAFTPTFIEEVRPRLDATQRAGLDEGFKDPEFAGALASFDQVAATGGLGELPLAIVTGENTEQHLGHEVQALWQHHQRTMLDLSTASRLFVADGVDYTIPTDAPGAVVSAVQWVDQER